MPAAPLPAASPPSTPARPTIALAVSGSIAAYKAVEVARLLRKAGARVIPLMTRSAHAFLGRMTLSGICGEPVREDMFDASFAGELHVELAEAADVVLLVPATADLLSRLATGRADDLVTALALCARGPVLAAPAMHPRMWQHPATERNVQALLADGRVELIGPVCGEVASGDVGWGRMEDPAVIAEAALGRITRRDLAGARIVVTAGPTLEDLDPVRFLGNRSSGKMGFSLAARAAARGAEVTLIAGPVALPAPFGVRRIDVRSALAMRDTLWQLLGPDLEGADALIMAAAVSDYRPAEARTEKLKRNTAAMALDLVANPDLLSEIGRARKGGRPVLVGFAVETGSDESILASARSKLASKGVDFIVANHAGDSFGQDTNRAVLVAPSSADALGVLSKSDLSDRILDRVAGMLG